MEFSIDPDTRTLSLMPETHKDAGIFGGSLALDVDGTVLGGGDAETFTLDAGARAALAFGFHAAGVSWNVAVRLSEDGQSCLVSSTIRNDSDAGVRLGKCVLLRVTQDAGSAALGEDRGDAVYLDCKASVHDTRVRRCSEDDGTHMVKTICHVLNRASGQALNLSFVTFDRINTEHRFTYEAGKGITALESYCDFDGFQLQPGASVASETLSVEIGDDAYAALERWADRVQARYQPKIWPRVPAGWVGWSWVDPFNVERYEDVVLRNARAVHERLPGFGLEYAWVSIGNIKDGAPGNWLEVDEHNFPNGIPYLVEELRKCGMKLGLWCGVFWICSSLPELVDEMEEALLRTDDGELMVSRKEWQHGEAGGLPRQQRPCCYALDGSHPKALEFLRKTFETYYEWGIRYYMVDFLHAGSGSTPGDHLYGDYHDMSLIKGPEVYRRAMRVVRDAAGEDTYLLSSTGPTFQSIGCVDAVRTGNDYGEGRALNPESYFYPATFVVNRPDFWTSHLRALANMASSYYTHRRLYLNDSGNVMTVDKPIPVSEAQIVATVFGINGGPMMIGDDLARLGEERLALIKKCLPRCPELAFPVDLFDSVFPDYPKLFHLRVEREWGGWDLVAVFNLGDEPMEQQIDFARIGLEPGREHVVWEFWNEQYMGAMTERLTAIVPPRSARLYRLSERLPHPWLLSTDMHARQGQAEIEDCEWDSDAMTLRGRATRPKGESGSVFITAPKGLCVANPQGLWIAKDGHDESLILRKALTFDGEPVEFEIGFAAIESALANVQP